MAGEGRDAQAEGDEDAQPPRKGIIHSTMEAISKAVHRGEGSKLKDSSVAAKSEGAVGESGDGGGAGGTASNDVSVDGAGAVDDGNGDVGPPSSKDSGVASSSAGVGGEASGGPVRQGEGGAPAGGDEGAPDVAAVDAAPGASVSGEPHATEKPGSRNTHVEGRGSSDAAVAAAPGHSAAGGGVASADGVGEEVREADGVGDQSDAAGLTGENSTERPARQGGASGSGAEPEQLESELVDPPDARPGDRGVRRTEVAVEVDSGQHQHTDSSTATTVEGVSAGAGAGAGAEAGGADHTLPPTTMSHASHDESLQSQGEGRLPSTTLPQQDGASAPALHGQPRQNVDKPSLPVLLLEEANAATLTAACLNTLTFSEFRDEVLARTQQAQQSAGGGVAIGGQYESIFKTLMNKIKTLEINQSLYSLYIGAWWWLGVVRCDVVWCGVGGVSRRREGAPRQR